jgi:S1-C subfamily serine protease
MTAAHCLRTAPKIQILGLKKADLEGSRIFMTKSETADCALIILPSDLMSDRQMPLWQHAQVLEDVVLIGYPNIPTLLSVQLAEKANVSTIIRGSISREVTDIFNSELLLVTAPVRGGFSGGPVINSSGLVVGMVSRQPFANLDETEIRRYDAAGFGLAIPTKSLLQFVEMINGNDINVIEERDQGSFEWMDG